MRDNPRQLAAHAGAVFSSGTVPNTCFELAPPPALKGGFGASRGAGGVLRCHDRGVDEASHTGAQSRGAGADLGCRGGARGGPKVPGFIPRFFSVKIYRPFLVSTLSGLPSRVAPPPGRRRGAARALFQGDRLRQRARMSAIDSMQPVTGQQAPGQGIGGRVIVSGPCGASYGPAGASVHRSWGWFGRALVMGVGAGDVAPNLTFGYSPAPFLVGNIGECRRRSSRRRFVIFRNALSSEGKRIIGSVCRAFFKGGK